MISFMLECRILNSINNLGRASHNTQNNVVNLERYCSIYNDNRTADVFVLSRGYVGTGPLAGLIRFIIVIKELHTKTLETSKTRLLSCSVLFLFIVGDSDDI